MPLSHAVHHLAHGQRVLEQRADLGNRHRRRHRRAQQRHVEALAGGVEFDRRLPAARDEHAGDVVAERRREHGEARLGVEALEVAHLALAEDEDAPRLEVLVEPGEREAGLLDVRADDGALEAAAAAQQFERQADGVRPAVQQARHAQRRRGHLIALV
jgi:hypothetical protein